MTGSQGVITKRIDLALLESQELLTRTLQRAALGALSMVLAAAAWFAVTTSFILVVIPSETLSIRLAAFGLLHGGVALGVVALARRRGEPLVLPNRNVALDTIEERGGVTDSEFTAQRDNLLQSIERDQEEVRVAVQELTGAARSSLDVREHIRGFPLTWAIGALLVGMWLGSRGGRDDVAGQGGA